MVAVLPFTGPNRATGASGSGAALGRQVMERIQTLEDITLAPTVARAGWVVGGGVRQNGEDVRVTVRVVEARAGDVAFTVEKDGSASELATLQAAVAADVAAGLARITHQPSAAAADPLAERSTQ